MQLPTFRSLVRWGLIGISYVFFVLVALLLIVATAAALLLESKRRSRDNTLENLKSLYIGIAYVLLAVISLAFFITRQRDVRRKLAKIPRDHVAIRAEDVPKTVYNFISSEYFRTAAILYASQPAEGEQAGWGVSGSDWAGVRLRRRLLDTIPDLDEAIRVILPKYAPIRPHTRVGNHLRPLESIIVARNKRGIASLIEYDAVIELARYAQREPTDEEFVRGMLACLELVETFQSYNTVQDAVDEDDAVRDDSEEDTVLHDVPILQQPRLPHSVTA